MTSWRRSWRSEFQTLGSWRSWPIRSQTQLANQVPLRWVVGVDDWTTQAEKWQVRGLGPTNVQLTVWMIEAGEMLATQRVYMMSPFYNDLIDWLLHVKLNSVWFWSWLKKFATRTRDSSCKEGLTTGPSGIEMKSTCACNKNWRRRVGEHVTRPCVNMRVLFWNASNLVTNLFKLQLPGAEDGEASSPGRLKAISAWVAEFDHSFLVTCTSWACMWGCC